MISLSKRFMPALLAAFLLLPLPAAGGIAGVQDYFFDRFDTDLHGFIEARGGLRLDREEDQRDASIGEARLQLDFSRWLGDGELRLKTDLLADGVMEELRFELREANYDFSPHPDLDVRLGRQVLTWGTGDLLFINDVFAKDWESFFIGRDDEYLKKASDAVRLGIFAGPVNLDLVYVPLVTHSNYIDGSRLSYWHGGQQRIAGRDQIARDKSRNRVFRDSETALRLYRQQGSIEYALYGYYGFWSTPEGMDPDSGRLIYPRLGVYGASVRGPLLGGISNLEVGYYHSLDDTSGRDPLIRNSEWRLLAGHERELARDLTAGLQYYLERKVQYNNYLASLPPGAPAADHNRHLLTLRLTRLLLQQNLTLSLFVYWSPSDQDGHLRPKANYKISDQLAVEAGANLFRGSRDHTFWGQFEDNSNVYLGLRRTF
ncbi:hypothetical protein [Desulfurivibrio alkaliphilus]|uniref:Alginate export domain-containing protein n=1 Tax=Desulfurivibrio alkaliphilus (strain DSM 19089 / UNIQEM U267 / AHT2) TaxID=589865 RepID=D6Z6D1_DESAT|nr:hypothetical protein [Desulfurivibrio alkaliphilus]ADH86896.1 conserved hypothetical protein [Desulfurivibrio alkaliphilus AHT 2]